jgi:2-polyprenyl-6-methoxyphenol hydroxylase-like FAD-dependent oxidoreductase
MSPLDAIVVGGGIGGLAVAGALARTGWRVTVLEQADVLAPVGAGIALEPNAVKALNWLGLGDALTTRAMAQGPAGLRTAGGRWLIKTRMAAFRERFGVPAYALHRAELHQLLLDAASGADLRTGLHVTHVRQGNHVTVHTTTDTLRADLVIAADGVHSAVRSSMFPEHPGPRYAGYVTWRGVVDADVPASVTETWGRGQRFGVVPLGDGRAYWFACVTGRPGTDHDLAELAEQFAGWPDPVRQLLAATRPESVLRHDIQYLRDPLPSYVEDRVVLLGDAAHAITPDLGQGAALALEDAVVLTAALAD